MSLKRIAIALFVLFAFAGTLLAEKEPQAPQTPQGAAGPSSPAAGVANAPSDEGGIKKREVYIYREEGRRDPFLSIITAAKQVEEVRKKGLTPLEDYDLTQISLRGIISTAKGYFALFGLPDGKHYTVKENSPMGIHDGKVVRITAGTVVVRQYLRDFKGRLQKEDYTFRLREEGQ